VGVNEQVGAPTRTDGVLLSRLTVALDLSWGEGPGSVPPRRVVLPSVGAPSARPLRPVFPLRPEPDGGLLVLADPQLDAQARQFLRLHDGRTTWQTLSPEIDDIVRWQIVDFLPDGRGGIYLLEYLDRRNEQWINRVRHVDGDGTTTWFITGPFDPLATDVTTLRGMFARLQKPAGGALWVIPRATSAGMLALDPEHGWISATARLDADILNLLVTPAGEAVYGRMADVDGQFTPMLASTDLSSGRTRFARHDQVSLLDLAGLDGSGRLHARAEDGIIRLDPRWRLRLRGAVRDPGTGKPVVAYGTDQADRLLIVEHEPDGSPGRTWSPHPDQALGRSATLVDIEPGPRFVLQVDGSARVPGTLLTVDGDGVTRPVGNREDDLAEELVARENRLDLMQTVIAADGAVLVPLSSPRGYHVLSFQPPDATGDLRLL